MKAHRNRISPIFGAFEPLINGASGAIDAFVQICGARRGRSLTKQLLTHDDRILTDIGISRSDIERALSVKWDEDPSLALAEIRRRRLQAYQQGFVRRGVA
jgi:Domain of unknown function (DUF1127)